MGGVVSPQPIFFLNAGLCDHALERLRLERLLAVEGNDNLVHPSGSALNEEMMTTFGVIQDETVFSQERSGVVVIPVEDASRHITRG